MKTLQSAGCVLSSTQELNLSKTFECGQCFRWNVNKSGIYTGIAYGHSLKIWEENGLIICDAPDCDLPFWRDYFDLDTNYAAATADFTQYDYLQSCAKYGEGIHILKQEPWEALCSFIISQCNNIPRIKKIVECLCTNFGELQPSGLFSFPSAESLAVLSERDLAPLHSGYRAAYIINAARAVAEKSLDFNLLYSMDAPAAIAELSKIHGVGKKVASCTVLFGLHKMDSFPIDVWIKRALDKHFPPDFDPKALGSYAGLAQQYIFFYARSNESK
ncbi:MAG: DNA glycosylase [Oscillospiraceae bacterium]